MVIIFGIGLFIYWLILVIIVVVGFVFVVILLFIDLVVVLVMIVSLLFFLRMVYIFEGELLLNDVLGFVVFNFVIVVVLIGSFFLGDVVVKFFLMVFGGIFSGFVVVWVIGKCNNFLVWCICEELVI